MPKGRFLSLTEQVAEHLRQEIKHGSYGDNLPGVRVLAEDLSIDMKTVNSALKELEADGTLISLGPGRGRRVNLRRKKNRSSLRIQILLYEKDELSTSHHIEIRHRLEKAGHAASFANKTLTDLGMSVNRVARYVKGTNADAWVVTAASREVLQWFTEQPTPAFALFGRFASVDIAATGPNKSTSLATAVNHLIDIGHKRIVMLTREARRKPGPAVMERGFLEILRERGIPVGAYNLPDWKDNRESFLQLLESLFKHTPPTALIIDDTPLFFAAHNFLAQRGLSAPRDLSMISLDPDPVYAWSEPAISHINWDSRPWVRRVVKWAKNVAHGKEDKKQQFSATTFVKGGTVGPAPKD